MADILTKIHNKLPALSKGKRRIAQYLLETCDQAAFQTAGVIGKTVQVSESTVVRFATDLGYDGYPEMQKALQELVRHRLTHAPQREEAPAVAEDLVSTILSGAVQQLRNMAEQLDRPTFDTAVEVLAQARKLYILGLREDGPLALLLSGSLQYAFEEVTCITAGDGREILGRLLPLTSEDVLLTVRFSADAFVADKAVEFARQMGARTVSLTDDTGDTAEHILSVEREQGSLVAPFGVIHALVTAVRERKKQEMTETLGRLEEIWDAYHV